MPSRSVFPIIMFVALSWGVPAFAQGNSDGNANANADSSNQASDNGNGNSNSQGGGNGQGSGDSPGNSDSQGNGNRPASTGPATTEPTVAPTVAKPTTQLGSGEGELSESDVLDAVDAGRAVPLASILPDIRARTGGQVINAKLKQVGDLLLYALTVLTPDGTVTTEFYDARSGHVVER